MPDHSTACLCTSAMHAMQDHRCAEITSGASVAVQCKGASKDISINAYK